MKLFLTEKNPMRAALKGLSQLPIVIHYDRGAQTANDMKYMIAAIRCRDRVRGITFQGTDVRLDSFFRVMTGAYPVLESLELGHEDGSTMVLPSTFLRDPAPNLRTLKLRQVSQTSLSQLSSATGLVELSLSLAFFVCPSMATLILGYLQGFPCLRRLQLDVHVPTPEDGNATTDPTLTESMVRLPKLTSFQFCGLGAPFKALVTRLAPPSLKDFHVIIRDATPAALHLARFINGVEEPFSAAQLIVGGNAFRLSLLTHSQLIDDPNPAFILDLKSYPQMMMGMFGALSAKLSIVEGLLLTYLPFFDDETWWFSEDPFPWRRFFAPFHGVKVLKVQRKLVNCVATSLLPFGGSVQELLPALEEVELRWEGVISSDSASQNQRASATHVLEQLVASRQKTGRSVNVSWKEPDHITWKFSGMCFV
jgi:hypothetical protein